jgi:hypothetical protein
MNLQLPTGPQNRTKVPNSLYSIRGLRPPYTEAQLPA